jgi:dUTP pyrophosphatase
MLFTAIEKLYPGVPTPMRATSGSAGYDLAAWFSGGPVKIFDKDGSNWEVNPDADCGLYIYPGQVAMIPVGFKCSAPIGTEVQIRPRSGLALKKRLVPVNTPGTIDEDYPDEWRVLLENRSDEPQFIAHGEKVAQAVFNRYEVVRFEEAIVGITSERTGGFGSTGR